MKQINIFDIKLHPFRRSEFISLIRQKLKDGEQIAQFGVNSATVNEIAGNEEYRRAINNADLLNIDGMSVVWALRCLGYKVPERVATPDLADDVLTMAEKEGFSVFLLGAKEAILLKCIANLMARMPSIIIAGHQHGYYDQGEDSYIIEKINETKPDILLIGMSSPKKELMCEKYRSELNAKYILGVGVILIYWPVIREELRNGCRISEWNGFSGSFRNQDVCGEGTCSASLNLCGLS